MSSTLAGLLPQLQQVLDDLVEVLRVQDLLVERRVQPQLGVQLQPADAREVVLLRVEEHVLEQRPRAVERRRIARPQAAVDLDQRLFVRVDRILLQRLADDRADLVALGEEDLDAVDVLLLRHRDDARRRAPRWPRGSPRRSTDRRRRRRRRRLRARRRRSRPPRRWPSSARRSRSW